MASPRDTDLAMLALRLQRRVIRFLTRAGRPVAWPMIRSSMWPSKPPDLRAVLDTLRAQGVLTRTTRHEPPLPHGPAREIERDYWGHADRTSESTDGA
jgi:hypothetical protein